MASSITNVVNLHSSTGEGVLKSPDGETETGVHYAVLDYIDGMDLFDFISKHEIPEHVSHHLFQQILMILSKLHEKGIYHLDLKPENFLISKDMKVYLTDFGHATQETSMSKLVGTLGY